MEAALNNLPPDPVVIGNVPIHFVTTRCDNCGDDSDREVFVGGDRIFHLPGQFRLVRCNRCGLIRQNPMPAEECLGAYYPPDYEPFETAIDLESSRARRWDRRYGMIKRRRVIERLIQSGSILDIGCATGNFLSEMKRSGRWTTTGIEPDAKAAAYAIAQHQLAITVGRLRDVPLEPEKYDVITLWNVLEHLPSPVTELRRLERALRPGGIIVFSLPNLESYEVALFGSRWFCWELPRHIYFFPARLLQRLLPELGLTIVERSCVSGVQVAFNLSLKYLYADRSKAPLWHALALNLVSSRAGRLALSPWFYLIGALRQGMIVTYVARKGVRHDSVG